MKVNNYSTLTRQYTAARPLYAVDGCRIFVLNVETSNYLEVGAGVSAVRVVSELSNV